MEKNSLPRKLTVREFFKRFPNDDACLDHVMSVRFGHRHTCRACGVVDATFHRLENRKAYCCAHCGDHLYPCAGTIFEASRTPLQVWFYAVYLFCVSRNGVSGMELHRTLGVTRKTGQRMARQIRILMGKGDVKGPMRGHIELDETLLGGAVRGLGAGSWASMKTTVMGVKERDGIIRCEVVPSNATKYLADVVSRNVEPGSTISTDEWAGYGLLEFNGFTHGKVNHSAKEYAVTINGVRHHVNGLENFWKHFKASIRGTHVHISKRHTPTYLAEFTYRANFRELGNGMFDALISAL